MSDSSIFATFAPYHVLSYGALLGTGLFHSFVGGIIAFKTLDRSNFRTLISPLSSAYFTIQTALPVVVALTYPARELSGSRSGLQGLLASENRCSSLIPLSTAFLAGLANSAFIGPLTTKIMINRKHQETRDRKKYWESGSQSAEMQRLNKAFGRMHGVSTLVNLVGIVATGWYGFSLAERIH